MKLVAFALVTLVACSSSTSSPSPSLGREVPSEDATTPTPNPPDESADATPEIRVPEGVDDGRQAEPDDAAPPDVARRSPCLADHLFCDDFDVGALGARWSSTFVNGKGITGSLATTEVRSAPQAFRVQIAETSSATWESFMLRQAVASATVPKGLRVEFELKTTKPPKDSSFTVAHLFVSGFSSDGVGFGVVPNGLRVRALAQGKEFVRDIAGGHDRWIHVRLDARLDPTDGLVTLYLDGVEAAAAKGIPTTGAQLSVGDNQLVSIGALVTKFGAASVSIDDVTIDAL
jgi:hypothetical protein